MPALTALAVRRYLRRLAGHAALRGAGVGVRRPTGAGGDDLAARVAAHVASYTAASEDDDEEGGDDGSWDAGTYFDPQARDATLAAKARALVARMDAEAAAPPRSRGDAILAALVRARFTGLGRLLHHADGDGDGVARMCVGDGWSKVIADFDTRTSDPDGDLFAVAADVDAAADTVAELLASAATAAVDGEPPVAPDAVELLLGDHVEEVAAFAVYEFAHILNFLQNCVLERPVEGVERV